MNNSRRIFARIPLNIGVEYDGMERFHPDRLLNISARGAFILTSRPFPENQTISFTFTLPDLSFKPIRAKGKVVWNPKNSPSQKGNRHPMGMGICFDPKDEKLFHLLDQYVTVSSALKCVDQRIGEELPERIRAAFENEDDL